jgi:ABC-type glycerol-3-phosphate transport system substrate-binding protein
MFPEDYDWENNDDYESDIQKIRTGRQMLYVATISDFNTVQLINKIFDDQATFVGYPTGTGEGNGSAFYMDTTLAMSSTCQNKEGAWEFIRILLTEDYQEENSWWFPTNKTMFDKKLEEAMTPEYRTDPETGEQVELSKSTWWVTDDETLEVYHMTEADRDMLMDIINNTTHVMNYDSDIYEVISEDAEAYFAGQKTAEEVAKLIQSRMNIYVNEQR